MNDKSHPFHTEEKEYGEKYKDHLIEQYKKYIDGVELLITRRQKTNDFFLTINTAMFTLVGFASKLAESYFVFVAVTISILGAFISIMWYRLMRSYRDIGENKYRVLHKMEERLPASLYSFEWDLLGKGEDKKKYVPIMHVEMKIPIVFTIFYAILLVVVLIWWL